MRIVTIKQVAAEAGVSVSAVSRAFCNGSLSEDKRKRVFDVATRLGYRPSSVAQGLVQNRTNTITLVTGRMCDPFDAMFLEQLAETLADRGRRLVVAPASKQGSQKGGLFQALDDRSDAVVVAAGTMPLEASENCVKVGMPVILAGRVLRAEGIDCVAAENADGGRQAAELFLRTGCRILAYLGFSDPSLADQERWKGFLNAAGKSDAMILSESALARDDEAGFDAAVRLLSAVNPPDSIFCATDRLAFTTIEAARALNFQIPAQLSIIGFNNIAAARRRSYRLTTIDYPVTRVVEEIVNLLDWRRNTPEGESQHIRISVNLVVRGTTRQSPT